jgi:hypothetical protein
MKALGLSGRRVTVRNTPALVQRQMVLDQLAKDPAGGQGPRTIRKNIIHDTGVSLTRYEIALILPLPP